VHKLLNGNIGVEIGFWITSPPSFQTADNLEKGVATYLFSGCMTDDFAPPRPEFLNRNRAEAHKK
jgi:hypothetical protein